MPVAYVPLAKVGDIAPGSMAQVELSGRTLLLVNIGGAYTAFPRECPHEGADLATGEMDGETIRCENHSYVFDLSTGVCVMPDDGPGLSLVSVEEREGEICAKLEW
jgi:3-phenylpropionate/trans-cinnamate dioxygenase ferredoxin subunit